MFSGLLSRNLTLMPCIFVTVKHPWSQMCLSPSNTNTAISLPLWQLGRRCVDGLIRVACWSVLDPRPFFSLLCKCWKTLLPQHCPDPFWSAAVPVGPPEVTKGKFLERFKSFFFIRRWTGTWECSFNLRVRIDTRKQSSLLVLKPRGMWKSWMKRNRINIVNIKMFNLTIFPMFPIVWIFTNLPPICQNVVRNCNKLHFCG